MKKILFLGLIATGLAVSFNAISSHAEKESSSSACKYGRCLKMYNDGTQCGNCAQQNSAYCWSHRPY
jgi:hypothetical protein